MGAEDTVDLVCVTGSWELMGSWIVKLLLERGYSVRCGVRISSEELSQLQSLPGAAQRLHLVSVDVLNYKSLAKTIRGCSGVIHSPAPHDMNGMRDYPADMIEYEIKGVLNVVEACANSETVRRLVLTSCLSTIVYTQEETSLDEKCWTNLDFCRENKLWSPLSKTLAERAAWALALDKGLDMVVLNPATVVSRDPSIQGLRQLHRDEVLAYAHVEEVASAHLVALEKPNAVGRYICFGDIVTGSNVKKSNEQILSNKKLSALVY
ncbi:hypothetical protein SELMODRAFT_271980 [Selaginella moellendorffii]|uniref:NAD-dependent epimerase/dehydratase domain-containing protein n=1 Tax=Selaginella moellendorffii TaxID=88036 RepID=D8SXX7_SELML|nr:cinnamoyl-CoA reductase 2 [Selaginella moellendorffii]EFJ10695.1 hypothetical protein SELMODRAFT_271980 [Selaginella moellendorffii]|eukprot:XP_002988276.1 cinnamoyl-CoA reductase 2 [Selaginella moellendorffii]